MITRISLTLCLCTLAACGRKPKQLYSHKESVKSYPYSRLTLPIVTNISATKSGGEVLARWVPLPQEPTPPPRIHERVELDHTPRFIGYNLYRFAKTGFIPKNPINNKLILSPQYRDIPPSDNYQWYYLIRAVFFVYGKKIEGPASKIARLP